MWTAPRRTMRSILDVDPGQNVLVLSVLYGLATYVAGPKDYGVFGIVVVPFLAVAVLYLGGAIYAWVGSWFGGTGSMEDLRAAIAWGYYLPGIAVSLVSGLIGLFDLPSALGVAIVGVGLVWAWALTLTSFAEAHKFGYGKSLLTLATPLVILFVLWALSLT